MISFKELGKMGRLGNQLFQISATIALALRNNDQYIFPPWNDEPNFNLHNCFSLNINYVNFYSEPSFNYQPIMYQPNLNIQGYFQSEKYFKDYQDVILNLLTPKIGFGIKWGYTAIHVRRGDYLNVPDCHPQMTMEYYNQAMKIINSSNYIVFSDDIAWCKSIFRGNNISFSENRSPHEDLSLFLSCEHNIIANSSFSWWGAYLNKNPSKIVIAPSKWFGSALSHDTKDLLPENWVKL